jgi:glutathione S-transferase
MLSLFWLGKPFKLCRIEDENDGDADYAKLNALDQVPLLFIDGDVITENGGILNHIGLEGVERGLHFKPGTREYDQLNRAIGFISSDLHKSFAGVWMPEIFHDDKKVQAQIKDKVVKGHLHDVIQHANDHLLRSITLYDRPTVGDAYLFALSQWMVDLYDLKSEFPNIARFREALLKDESVRKAVAVDEGKLKEGDGRDGFLGHVEFKSFVKEAVTRKEARDRERGEGEFTRLKAAG